MEIIDGRVKDYDERGILTVVADYPNAERFINRAFKTCRIVLNDSREISAEQRKKAYALLNEISEYMGEMPEYTKRLFKLKFIHDTMKGLADGIFSLSDCDVTTAKEFITYLIDFIIAHEIPTRVPLAELCEDVQKFVYACAMQKVCCVCGRKADLHHYDAIGSKYDRSKAVHEGLRALPLCREHHTEAHNVTKEVFLKKYHIEPIVLDKKLCKKWRLPYEF